MASTQPLINHIASLSLHQLSHQNNNLTPDQCTNDTAVVELIRNHGTVLLSIKPNQTKESHIKHLAAAAADSLSLSLAIELQPKEYPQWSIERHNRAPKAVKDLVLTMTMIRSIALWSSISLLPNELLFLIFEHLDFETILRVDRDQRRPLQQSNSHDLNNNNLKCHVM